MSSTKFWNRLLSLAAAAVIVTGLAALVLAQTPQKTPPPLPPGMTGSSTNDPRVNLKAGVFDAGEAAFGMKHLGLMKKPAAFDVGTDPDSPIVGKALTALGIPADAKIPAELKMSFAPLAFANSDIAFQGDHLFLGNFYGINIYNIADPTKVELVTSMPCPGGQGDVSVYKNLMFMSVEMPNGRLDCGEQGFPPVPVTQTKNGGSVGLPAANKDRFRGVRIFDISDIRAPKQVAAVQTCRGSHTHTLVPDPKDPANIYVYVSGTSFVRSDEEMAGCSGGAPDKDPNTALFRIDVIKVPVAAPQEAKIVSSPRVFIDPRTGAYNGLNDGGSHDGKGKTSDTDQCHDITVYPEIGLAAGACSGNGLLLDIKDPANPKRIDAVNDPNYAYWHSAAFSNDGKKVVFTDEWGGGMGARCRATDPNVWGADAIFDIVDNKLKFQSYYKMPAAQSDQENCVAHNGSLVPVPGRDIKVQAWYQGGISIMDFTDPAKPFEIAYFDRGPVDPKIIVLGGSWSAYWYNGNIYSSEIARGLDVFALTPTKFLSQNEIDAAKTIHLPEWNVQSQRRINWANKPVVAKAYVDQLERSSALSAKDAAAVRKTIDKAADRKDAKGFAKALAVVQKAAGNAKNDADKVRFDALAEVLKDPQF